MEGFTDMNQSIETLELENIPNPEISVLESEENYARFAVGPLHPGYGITLGNPMRRVLLTSIEGTAITWVKIEGILHEFSTLKHMKEDIEEFLMNVKAIRLKSLSERPGKLRLDMKREGPVTAGDIALSSDFEIVNPELHLATLESDKGILSVEFNVEQGRGYVPSGTVKGTTIGIMPVDAIFSPVKKVNFTVENTRVGQATNFERLVLDVWTDGTVTPVEAVKNGADFLLQQFFLFANADKAGEGTKERPSFTATIPMEQYNTPIEKLDLSSRTLNCLKRTNLNKVGQVLETEEADLIKIRNFGVKSLNELNAKLLEFGFVKEQATVIMDETEKEVINDVENTLEIDNVTEVL
jgi:DNA-directed RNA polymerase subunit alpha